MIRRWSALSLCSVLVYMMLSNHAIAETNPVGFSVEAVPHPLQANKQVGYFDLLLDPANATTIDVKIYNHMSEKQTFDLTIANADTNENGVIVYDRDEPTSGDVSLTDLVDRTEQTVTVQASDTKIVSIPLKALETDVLGNVLGGISISKHEDATLSEGVGVQNRYQYIVGVKLMTSLKKVAFAPEWGGVALDVEQYYPKIGFIVHNRTGAISADLKVEMAIRAAEGTTKRHRVNAQFAPHTSPIFHFPVKQRLEPGTYETTLTMTDEVSNETWTWTDTLEVTEEAAAAIEERVEGPVVEQSSFFGTGWTVSVVTGLLVLCVSYIVYLRRKLIRSEEGRR